jgi:hypothetical protein
MMSEHHSRAVRPTHATRLTPPPPHRRSGSPWSPSHLDTTPMRGNPVAAQRKHRHSRYHHCAGPVDRKSSITFTSTGRTGVAATGEPPTRIRPVELSGPPQEFPISCSRPLLTYARHSTPDTRRTLTRIGSPTFTATAARAIHPIRQRGRVAGRGVEILPPGHDAVSRLVDEGQAESERSASSSFLQCGPHSGEVDLCQRNRPERAHNDDEEQRPEKV